MNCLFVRFGAGRHIFLSSLSDAITTMKIEFATRVVYQFVICFTKLGICSFYLRVFQDKQSKRIIYSLLGFILITALATGIAFIFSCRPVSAAWAIDGRCGEQLPSIYANTIASVMADVALMVFVIPRVRESLPRPIYLTPRSNRAKYPSKWLSNRK